MSRPIDRLEARKIREAGIPKGPAGRRPEQAMRNGALATRAAIRNAIYLMKRSARRAGRLVEYKTQEVRSKLDGKVIGKEFVLDADKNRIPTRVLHETKGWQKARIGL